MNPVTPSQPTEEPDPPQDSGADVATVTRTRFFTPGEQGRPLEDHEFKRVVSPVLMAREEMDTLEEAGAHPSAHPTWESAGVSSLSRQPREGLPQLLPNKALNLLEDVHELNDPAALERRVSRAFLISAAVLLSGVVLFVLGSIFLFRASNLAPSAAGPSVPPSAEPQASITPLAAAERTAEALGVLKRFLGSKDPAERQQLIGFDQPLPPLLQIKGTLPALQRLQPDLKGAKLVLLGGRQVVLMPVNDGAGHSRTAALLEHEGRFRLDWRSLVTPETVPWRDFLARPGAVPRLFRVSLAFADDGRLTLTRPDEPGSPLAVHTVPGSRTVGEVSRALAQSKGRPLSADVYLASIDGSPQLTLVGWTQDKWSL